MGRTAVAGAPAWGAIAIGGAASAGLLGAHALLSTLHSAGGHGPAHTTAGWVPTAAPLAVAGVLAAAVAALRVGCARGSGRSRLRLGGAFAWLAIIQASGCVLLQLLERSHAAPSLAHPVSRWLMGLGVVLQLAAAAVAAGALAGLRRLGELAAGPTRSWPSSARPPRPPITSVSAPRGHRGGPLPARGPPRPRVA